MHGIYDPSKFIVLSQMAQRPFFTLFILGVLACVVAGLLIHPIERSMSPALTVYDGPWLVAITQLTVGFGDLVPMTDLGRFICIGPGLLGVLTLSLVVSYSTRELALSRNEKRLIESLYNLRYTRNTLKSLACVYIQRRWRLELARRSHSINRLLRLVAFKQTHRQFKVKFGKALKTTPELEDELVIFRNNVMKVLQEGKRRLYILKNYRKMASYLSTNEVSITARMLGFKQACYRITWHVLPNPKRKRKHVHRQISSKISASITNKKESDLAMRKLITRLHSKAETRLFEDEDDTVPRSLRHSYRYSERMFSQRSSTIE